MKDDDLTEGVKKLLAMKVRVSPNWKSIRKLIVAFGLVLITLIVLIGILLLPDSTRIEWIDDNQSYSIVSLLNRLPGWSIGPLLWWAVLTLIAGAIYMWRAIVAAITCRLKFLPLGVVSPKGQLHVWANIESIKLKSRNGVSYLLKIRLVDRSEPPIRIYFQYSTVTFDNEVGGAAPLLSYINTFGRSYGFSFE